MPTSAEARAHERRKGVLKENRRRLAEGPSWREHKGE